MPMPTQKNISSMNSTVHLGNLDSASGREAVHDTLRDGRHGYQRNLPQHQIASSPSEHLKCEDVNAKDAKYLAPASRLGKFSCLWHDGIYLGIRGASGEIDVRALQCTKPCSKEKPKERT